MCGIAGILSSDANNLIDGMLRALAHRGPDDRQHWRGGGVAIGVQRLAIVDRAGGRQPFIKNETILICNGEIYNHKELRKTLEEKGHVFQTECDVEVILHGYLEWGSGVAQQLRGQFAFAIWDNRKRRLMLARDRFGIVPLVYTRMGGAFSFASEAKALLSLSGVQARVNRRAVDDYMAMRYAPGPETFFEGIFLLEPGHMLLVDREGTGISRKWAEAFSSGSLGHEKLSYSDATENLQAALANSVGRRLQGEVPIGTYLSGGLDSAVIGGFANKLTQPLPAFTHGFDGVNDEIPSARKVSAAIGGSLEEVPLQSDLIRELPNIIRATEFPVANSDVMGLWALARTASKSVRVVLCGEGADEIFGSYPHQQLLLKLQTRSPEWKSWALKALRLLPSSWLKNLGPYAGVLSDPLAKERIIQVLESKELHEQYRLLTTLFSEYERSQLYSMGMKKEISESPGKREKLIESLSLPIPEDRILDSLTDLKMTSFLPDYHLGRENRVAMAFGMEARYPFLDEDVIQATLPLSSSFKVGGRPPEKRLLRSVARNHLPKWIARRPKGPVRVPLHLFSKEFDEMKNDLLTQRRLRHHGIIRPNAIESLRKKENISPFIVQRQLFALVMLEVWFETFNVSA